MAEAERSAGAAEAYDTAENMVGSYGYYLDESPGEVASLFARGVRGAAGASNLAPGETIFVNQILQPVIDVARDGKSAKIRARLVDLGGSSGGAGYWMAGSFEGQIALEQGAWRFQTADSVKRWSAAYPGGWARSP